MLHRASLCRPLGHLLDPALPDNHTPNTIPESPFFFVLTPSHWEGRQPDNKPPRNLALELGELIVDCWPPARRIDKETPTAPVATARHIVQRHTATSTTLEVQLRSWLGLSNERTIKVRPKTAASPIRGAGPRAACPERTRVIRIDGRSSCPRWHHQLCSLEGGEPLLLLVRPSRLRGDRKSVV